MNRIHEGSRWLLVFAPALMVLTGCGRQEGSSTDSSTVAGRQAANTAPTVLPNVQHVIQMTSKYKFDGDSAPMPATSVINDHGNNHPVSAAQDPRMTIAAAIWVGPGKESDVEQVVALVKAKHAYDGLGVLPNTSNFLWRTRSSTSAPWEVWMVPEQGHGPVQLLNDHHSYSQGHPERPRLMYQGFPTPAPGDTAAAKMFTSMILGICVEDQAMCGGHCGYTR